MKGSDPVPGESEADYVARQRSLQEEVEPCVRSVNVSDRFGNPAKMMKQTSSIF